MKKLLIAIFIVSLSVIGCEIPYTGPMLTVDDVDQYLHSTGEDAVCLQDGLDSLCVKLTPGARGPQGAPGPPGPPGSPGANAPIIHIHEQSIIYDFYHENKLILRAEKQMDTSELLEQLAAQQGDDAWAQTADANSVFPKETKVGWIVRIYYQNPVPLNRGLTLGTSGFDVAITVDAFYGLKTPIDANTPVSQTRGPDGEAIEFFIHTESNWITISVVGIFPDFRATFTFSDGIDSIESVPPGEATLFLSPSVKLVI